MIWTAVNVFFHFTIGLLLALTLNQKLRGRTSYRLMLLLPWAVPAYISAISWSFIFNGEYGLLNNFLASSASPAVAMAVGVALVLHHADHRERLARDPVHDGGAVGRAAVDPRRPVRGGADGRRHAAGSRSGTSRSRSSSR